MLLLKAGLALLGGHLLPGYAAVRLLGVGRNRLERLVLAAVAGGPLAAAVYLAALLSGWPGLYWALLLALDLAALGWAARRPLLNGSGPGARRALAALLVFLALLEGAYWLTTGRLNRLDAGGNLQLDSALQRDALFHLGLVRALESSYPPELLSFSGRRAAYHLGYDLQVAAWSRYFAIDPLDGLYRVGPAWHVALLGLSAYLLGLRFHPGGRAAPLGAALVLGSGLGYLFPGAPGGEWWSLTFLDASLVSLFLVNPLLPALPLLFLGLAVTEDYVSGGRPGALLAGALALASLFTLKVFLGVQAAGAAGLALLLSRGESAPRLRRAALAVLVLAAPLLAWSLLQAGEANTAVGWRPLELVRYSMEKLGRDEAAAELGRIGGGEAGGAALWRGLGYTLGWAAGFLGLRLVALPGLVRDLRARAGSVRFLMAVFCAVGFPAALLLRIAPAEATGLSRLEAINDVLWFSTQSGLVLWFWTAEWLAARGRLGMLLALLAFPSTVQHFVFKASVPADRVSAATLELGRQARRLSAPGEVFVERPDRARPSPIAYLSGRPVVFDGYVGYDYMFVSRPERDWRRHAVAHFWRSEAGYAIWFLGEFRVSWIHAPPDWAPPPALSAFLERRFINDSGALHRVREALPNDFPIEPPPASLPLAGSGAHYFGEGWGPPEGSPRARALLPGGGSLYLPLDRGLDLRVIVSGAETFDVELPARSLRRGLNRIRIPWSGPAPMRVERIRLEH